MHQIWGGVYWDSYLNRWIGVGHHAVVADALNDMHIPPPDPLPAATGKKRQS